MEAAMCWFIALWATACTASSVGSLGLDVPNANHIFNAIHDSMRQFGNSLNHNGMSVFLATVPRDTELYHGTGHADRTDGTDWVAFEPEHASIFAAGSWVPPPDDPDEDDPRFNGIVATGSSHLSNRLQAILGERTRLSPPHRLPGYLHTYRTKHDLKLLYVDGQSAGKSSKGTLDIQDYILLPEPPSTDPEEWLPFNDLARAKSLCHTAATEWNDKIDGIIRMEAGFEIILCDFEKSLDVVRIMQAPSWDDVTEDEWKELTINYYKAISARYDGIGGDRVSLDYDHFITMFNQSALLYYNDAGLPRVDNTSKTIPFVREQVKQLAFRKFEAPKTNWQATTDMIIARYADRIAYLTSGDLKNLSSFRAEVDRALRPFIDYSSRDSKAETFRCAHQFLPGDTKPLEASLAYHIILNVTTTICSTLSSLLSEDITMSSAVAHIKDLQSWLGWTEWKKCRGCGFHDYCFLPIWPIGTKEDFEQPRCASNISRIPIGYWTDDFELLSKGSRRNR